MAEPHNFISGEVSGQVIQAGRIEALSFRGGPALVPRETPPMPAHFVGRQDELRTLDRLTEAGGPTMCVVQGMGGVGKTALVVMWAERMAGKFPDGQIFVDMRGYSAAGTPLSSAEVLGLVLRSLGVTADELPADLDARASQFRTLVSSRRLLIILDNVAAAEQVLPLVIGSGDCRLVVTSRQSLSELTLATSRVSAFRVDPMSPDLARELLDQVLGLDRTDAEPDAVATIINECAGLPLALRIVGARAADSKRPLAELATELAAVGAGEFGEISVETAFSWTYQHLSANAARLFRFLGLHPGGQVTVEEAAALVDLPPNTATDALDELVRQNMLAGDYRLHALVHSYAHELLLWEEEQERLAAEGRLRKITRQPRQNVDWADDMPARVDRLNRTPLAGVLADRLRKAQQEQPDVSFLIHLDGPWGAGKTSLLNLLQDRLHGTNVVMFNAWRYARVEPPWWALITCMRDQLIGRRQWWLRIRETVARIRRSGASYLLAMLVLVLLGVGVVMLLGPIPLTPKDFGDYGKAVAGGLAALAVLWSAGKVVSRLLLWNSARGARLFEQSHTNPMHEVTEHFAWLVEHSRKPVVLFIDDLDRCDEKFVVAILEAVQNLVRDAPAGTGRIPRAANFVVAADGAWLRRAYEKTYENFQGAVDEPGRPLGHLFLDKLFQLSVPMPAMGTQVQSGYFDTLLGIAPAARRELTEEVQEVRARVVSGRTEGDVLEALDNASPAARQAVISDAVTKMSAPEVSEATEHTLQKFAPLLLANPEA
ncbi:P-loop NTPase fold protein [Kutzneria chonburiensis]|uniref:P-loop NTPase fold protein n=1 Tax=Kutzneria chonburiensis TaxID=1483604 RepID=UPI00235F8BB7|nr:P-loop NTPase fold protein [Kutzneria chonburiensis]